MAEDGIVFLDFVVIFASLYYYGWQNMVYDVGDLVSMTEISFLFHILVRLRFGVSRHPVSGDITGIPHITVSLTLGVLTTPCTIPLSSQINVNTVIDLCVWLAGQMHLCWLVGGLISYIQYSQLAGGWVEGWLVGC